MAGSKWFPGSIRVDDASTCRDFKARKGEYPAQNKSMRDRISRQLPRKTRACLAKAESFKQLLRWGSGRVQWL